MIMPRREEREEALVYNWLFPCGKIYKKRNEWNESCAQIHSLKTQNSKGRESQIQYTTKQPSLFIHSPGINKALKSPKPHPPVGTSIKPIDV